MKKFKLTFSALIAAMVISSSCTDNDNPDVGCLHVLLPTDMNFNIKDKNTERDLFFADNPVYTLSDLTLKMKDPFGKYTTMKLNVNQTNGEKYLTVSLPIPSKLQDTVYVGIADTPTDTLIYTTQPDDNEYCPQYILDKVSFNKTLVASNIGQTRIVLQKSRYAQ